MNRKAAVIDMGTNTFHLLLVQVKGRKFQTLYKEKIPVKIGQGGISQNTILPEAQKRAFHTLAHFKNLIAGENIEETAIFATSAVRNATNGESFVRQIREKFDLHVEIIDGQREAELIYGGIKLSGCLGTSTSLMMDIGGGSVEFIIGNQEEIFWKGSFEIGGQRMLDLFHNQDPIRSTDVENLKIYLGQKLSPLIKAIETLKPHNLVGASGTFDTLSDIYEAKSGVKKDRHSQQHQIPIAEFEEISSQLIGLNKQERLKIKGMIPMRVDMIVVASCLIQHILSHIQVTSIICSSYSLKEGAVAELFHKKTGNVFESLAAMEK
ncbi:Ppx/GppA phosphatase family protein [Pleomorphovibrio marinus]|uniref:Ppx/GppA phosphatase family protein n=1 Tax=Pleomorphovibrio marinus TaxID=2164132 RepID=UPI000E0A2810|nr:exopolyphosphatase [Pleomorphovibrio marinus]